MPGGLLGNTLKAFLAKLAIDPDALSEFFMDPDGCMARAGVDAGDRELVGRAQAQELLARLSADSQPETGAGTDGAESARANESPSGGSLLVVGTGIKSVGQLTVEAIAYIKSAERVFYLVAEPIAGTVIAALNPAGSQSLADLYTEGKPRRDTYREMVERILASVRSGWRTCAVFYGHPGVFVDPAHSAIRQARKEGFKADMIAGVSAEDCMFADLGIDPATAGCQSYEATDFLVNRRRVDPTSHVVIWQAGVLGDRTFSLTVRQTNALELLVERLVETYPREHELCIYQAAVLPGCKPVIKWAPLGRLEKSQLSIISTLYIPPSEAPRFDLELYFALAGIGRTA